MNFVSRAVVAPLLALGFVSVNAIAEERPGSGGVAVITVPGTIPGFAGPLEDGKVYQIINEASGRCLDVFDHLLTSGSQIKQWDCTGENHQKFVAKQFLPGVYTLAPLRFPKLCVDIAYHGTENGDRLVQHSACETQPNILVEKLDADSYKIALGHSGKCLDLDNSDLGNGAKVQQWDCHGEKNQLWNFKKVSVADQTKTYNLKNVHSGLCLDVVDFSLENNAELQQYGCWTDDNQAFTLVQGEGENVFIRGVQSGKAVVVAGDSQASNASVIQFRVRPEVIPSSVHTLLPVAGAANTYQIRFDHSKKCLTIPGRSKDEGTRAVQSPCGINNSQQWELIEKK